MAYLPIAVALGVGIALGIVIHIFITNRRKPVYLVVSAEVRNEEALEPYRQQAVPLAEAAGLEILGSGEIELMEGDWDHFPALTLEKFDSKAALHKFWYSPEYQQAKKLREGHLDVQFIVAIEGV
ncbi:MAG: DUF1330 domain-containing protein [Gammaproteobacteria bacterium]|jgi:uncharacterized protein (DUF1330 family)|nr:DUF1330 domain-containing protein [Gammaproteobacteria bacterium]MBT5722763.1 DUF1330 domain-containing protein [Gammaproteobacteria bacterium]MBT6586574.1 DUF1330 domain-containing protein [Gammaproteobacteria bacterium]MBT6889974.1 DUF1330 domain-containing protein [Gammaproteobacteria bacterium]